MAYEFHLHGAALIATTSGALWWEDRRTLAVADLHLGKSERMARRGGTLLPPYETMETLTRLSDVIDRWRPATVICLGDSFDDDAAAQALTPEAEGLLARLAAGRRWIWITGNHDPGPLSLPGEVMGELGDGGLIWRHIAAPGAVGEISAHYHPKARVAGRSRPAFLIDRSRVILPAFGAYTGGLDAADPAFDGLMAPDALAVLTGRQTTVVPRKGLIGQRRMARA